MNAGIIGVGSYVPKKVLTNFELEKMIDTSDEWIRTRTGIAERRVVDSGTFTSDLAAQAGLKALDEAKVSPQEIDLMIVATSSPDMIFPSTACLAQNKMGLKDCPAFDISAACTGFVYALAVADSFISSKTFEKVLVIGADALTRHVNWKDRNTCVLFGDGAGAVILGPVAKDYGILANYLAADGDGANLLKIPAGGSQLPGSEDSFREGLHFVSMNGNEVFKFAVRVIPEAVRKVLSQTGISLEEVNYIIPHQANQRIIEAAVSRLKVKPEKMVSNISKYGNTSTASIPLVIDELWKEGNLKSGDLILLVGFGAGLTWGASLIRWHKDPD